MRQVLLLVALLAATVSMNAQQLRLPALSPTSTIKQEFSTTDIEITYSRPSMRGRVIMNDLVPFNTVWRTGANAATKITFGADVEIGGTTVKAGTYSFYTVPDLMEWEIIINTNTGNWGAFGYDKKDDVVRMKVKPTTLPWDVETFTMSIGNLTFNSCTIDLMWERTMVSVPVTINNNDQIVKDIKQTLDSPRLPYRSAALYLYNTDQNMDDALMYAQKALESNQEAYWNHLLVAQCAAKVGKSDLARAHVAKARELTKGTEAEQAYVATTQEVLDSLK